MSSHKVGLNRLKRVFGLLERAHAMELVATDASVAEVDRAVASVAAERWQLSEAAETALASGEREEQAVTRALQQRSMVMLGRLDELREDREALRIRSQERYQASRIRLQQMEIAVEWVTTQVEEKKLRSLRNEEVGRYMSRREWLKHRGQGQNTFHG